jgi:erythrin-vacuolar iron transport family protein
VRVVAQHRAGPDHQTFLLQQAQPAMNGLVRRIAVHPGSHLRGRARHPQPHYAFFAGLATALGAGVSMAFSEGLSDIGDLT